MEGTENLPVKCICADTTPETAGYALLAELAAFDLGMSRLSDKAVPDVRVSPNYASVGVAMRPTSLFTLQGERQPRGFATTSMRRYRDCDRGISF